MSPGRALVLGGGGITGIAWEIGVLAGLAADGVNLTTADMVIGTSAGSVVGAQVTSGVPLEELYAAQIAGYGAEVAARMRPALLLRYAATLVRTRDPVTFRRRIAGRGGGGQLRRTWGISADRNRWATLRRRRRPVGHEPRSGPPGSLRRSGVGAGFGRAGGRPRGLDVTVWT